MGPPIPPASAETKLVSPCCLNVDATLRTHCTASLSRKAATIWSRLPLAVAITVSSPPVNQSMNVERRPARQGGGLSMQARTVSIEINASSSSCPPQKIRSHDFGQSLGGFV